MKTLTPLLLLPLFTFPVLAQDSRPAAGGKTLVGIGGPKNPQKWIQRRKGRELLREEYGAKIHETFAEAIDSVVKSQHEEGHWGEADVGVTALCVLALLGDGSHPHAGDQKTNVRNGIKWLRTQVTEDTTIEEAEDFTRHAWVTMAFCEAYEATGSPMLKQTARRGLETVLGLNTAVPAAAQPWMVALEDAALAAELLKDDERFAERESYVSYARASAATLPLEAEPLELSLVYFGTREAMKQGGDSAAGWRRVITERVAQPIEGPRAAAVRALWIEGLFTMEEK